MADPRDRVALDRVSSASLGHASLVLLTAILSAVCGAIDAAHLIPAQPRGADPLAARNPALATALDQAIQRAPSLEPDARPATALAFAAAVVQAVGL